MAPLRQADTTPGRAPGIRSLASLLLLLAAMCPLSHGRYRRLWRWGLAILLLPPLLLLGSVEATYLYTLSRVGELPQAPIPRRGFVYLVLWSAEEAGPLQLEPLWPWSILDQYIPRTARNRRDSAGRQFASLVARRWVVERPQREGEQHLDRIFQELALTIWLSRHWTAEEVLTAYAEGAGFGKDIIGLDAAARRYFGKQPEQLALHEAALLAGLPPSPSRYDPFLRPEAALERREYVLGRLRASGLISEAQLEEAREQPLLPGGTRSR